jgi:UDP-N-acetylglucosamine 2-epimerase
MAQSPPARTRKRDLAYTFVVGEVPRLLCTVVLVLAVLQGALWVQWLGPHLSATAPAARSQQDSYSRHMEGTLMGREKPPLLRREVAAAAAAPPAAPLPPPPPPPPGSLPPGAVVVVFGTRPEAVKMLTVIRELRLRRGAHPVVCINSGQHDALLHETLAALGAGADADTLDLNLAAGALGGPALVVGALMTSLGMLFAGAPPAMVVVQGDTSTAAAAAQAAYLVGAPVAHVEAGLRSFSGVTPFPEEFFRTAITASAQLHLAPTHHAANMLAASGAVRGRVHVVGNTGVDATLAALEALAGGGGSSGGGGGAVAPTLAAAFAGTSLGARLTHVPALAAVAAGALRNEVPGGLQGLWAELPRGGAMGLPVYAKLCHPFCAAGTASDGATCLQQATMRALAADGAAGVAAEEVWVVFTMHRRESFGRAFEAMVRALGDLIEAHYPRLHAVWPLHPNPAVAEGMRAGLAASDAAGAHEEGGAAAAGAHGAAAHAGVAGGGDRAAHLASHLHVMPPLPPDEVTALLLATDAVVTDSGGLQEEAVSVFFCRAPGHTHHAPPSFPLPHQSHPTGTL